MTESHPQPPTEVPAQSSDVPPEDPHTHVRDMGVTDRFVTLCGQEAFVQLATTNPTCPECDRRSREVDAKG